MKTITVFGSSQVRPNDPLYDTAVDIGAGLAQAGFKVMTGGYYGMMEAVSKGARQADGHVIGVTADQIGKRYDLQPNAFNCEIVHFADLRDRLWYMVENADAYLAMPGGTGTLHEIAETWELMRIGAIPVRPFICFGKPLARHHWGATGKPLPRPRLPGHDYNRAFNQRGFEPSQWSAVAYRWRREHISR